MEAATGAEMFVLGDTTYGRSGSGLPLGQGWGGARAEGELGAAEPV